MEIVIRTDGEQSVAGAAGIQQGAAGQGAAQPGGSAVSPPADLAAQAEAIGAIDAGPARLPTDQAGQPLADIAAIAHQQLSAAGGDGGATAAGAAPGYADEAEPTMVEAPPEKGGGEDT